MPMKSFITFHTALPRKSAFRIHFTSVLFDNLIRYVDVVRPYIEAARWIPLGLHPFASVTTLLYAGIAAEDDERYFMFYSLPVHY